MELVPTLVVRTLLGTGPNTRTSAPLAPLWSSLTQAVMWVLMTTVQYEVPSVTGFKHTPMILRGLAGFSAFFSSIGVIVFVASNAKTSFCKRFDADAALPCNYGSSFGAAVSAIVFQLLALLILVKGVSADLGATYSFKGGFEEAGSGGGGTTGGFQATFQGSSSEGGGYNTTPIDADSGTADKPFRSAYQDIGA